MDPIVNLPIVESILSRNLSWIAAADNKVGPVLAIDTAMLGALAAMAASVGGWHLVSVIPPIIAASALGASIVSLAFATFPRLSGPRASLVFFGGIVGHSRDAYAAKLLSTRQDEILIDLAEQAHRNAEIAVSKYRFVRSAMICLFFGIPFWIMSIYILYAHLGGLVERVTR
jgi:hypothetical protein